MWLKPESVLEMLLLFSNSVAPLGKRKERLNLKGIKQPIMQKLLPLLLFVFSLAACGDAKGPVAHSSNAPDTSVARSAEGSGPASPPETAKDGFPRNYASKGFKIHFLLYANDSHASQEIPQNQGLIPDEAAELAIKDDCYQLQLNDGSPVKVCDIPDEVDSDMYRSYQLKGSFKDLPYWFFLVDLYEGNASVIINRNTGHRREALPEFVVSPDKKQVLAYHRMDAYGWAGIEMYRAGKDSLSLEWSVEMDDWGPEEIHWTEDGAIKVKGLIGTEDSDSQYVQYLTLQASKMP